MSAGSLIILFGDSWTGCRNPTASGLLTIVRNGFALRPAFLILSTRRVMASIGRSVSHS
jgi:hypothetical protein